MNVGMDEKMSKMREKIATDLLNRLASLIYLAMNSPEEDQEGEKFLAEKAEAVFSEWRKKSPDQRFEYELGVIARSEIKRLLGEMKGGKDGE